MDNGLPSSGAVQALWTRMYLLLVFCVCLWHVALITDVDGNIGLIAVSPRLANAKPLRSSLLVSVDDVRYWKVVAQGSSLGLGQLVSPLRRLAPLKCSAPLGSLSHSLVTSNYPIFLT